MPSEFVAGAAFVLALLTFVLHLIKLRKPNGNGHADPVLKSELERQDREIERIRTRLHGHANMLQRIMGALKIDIEGWEEKD